MAATELHDRGSIHSGMGRNWPFEIAGFPGETREDRIETGSLSVRTLLGSFSSSHRLGLIDLKVMAFVIERWMEQHGATGNPGDPADFTLYGLGMAIYGREPEGEHRRLLGESIERLFRVEVNSYGEVGSGDDAKIKKIARDGRIFAEKETVWDQFPEDAPDLNEIAGRRGGTFRVWLGPWLVEQLQAGHFTNLNFATMRELSGLALRLWVFLQAQPFIVDGDQEFLAPAVPVNTELLNVLGVHYARPTDSRRALREAARKIMDADHRYSDIAIEGSAQQGYALGADRRRDDVPQLDHDPVEQLAA